MKVDFSKQFVHHGIEADSIQIIEKENLLPERLVNRMHITFPQISILKEESKAMFTSEKNRYTGIEGFREIIAVLNENGIDIGYIEERELFINVYRFLATKHILNTINWKEFQKDSVFQLVFPQPGMMKPELIKEYMAAKSAKRHNKDLKIFYNRLVKNGKPKKVALVAVMRKLLVMMNAIMKTYIKENCKTGDI